MTNGYVEAERRDGVLKLTLSDSATRNALGPEMVSELQAELDRFEETPEDRVLLLTGREPSFCSGANVRRFNQTVQERESEAGLEAPHHLPWGDMETRLGQRRKPDPSSGALIPLRLHQVQKPTIAAVNGHAIGVGMGIALACDIRLASESAQFSEAFVRMGLIPGDGSCWQLPRLIGLTNTFLLQYTGDRIDGAEAYRMGLVSRVYPAEELMSSAMELATRIAVGATYAMSLTKYLIHQSLEMGLEESLNLAHVAQELVRDTQDHREAVRAFLEKRRPEFKGK